MRIIHDRKFRVRSMKDYFNAYEFTNGLSKLIHRMHINAYARNYKFIRHLYAVIR